MKTIYNKIEAFTETKNMFVNGIIIAVVTFIAATLIVAVIKIAMNPENIQLGNW